MTTEKIPLVERRRLAEERSWALLRSLVSEEEWDGRKSGTIRVFGKSGRKYHIRLVGSVENIVMYEPNGVNRRVCGGPYMWNDYLDVGASFPRVDMARYNQARDEARSQGSEITGLPLPDFWLGQYLALKYDEDAFLDKAHVCSY